MGKGGIGDRAFQLAAEGNPAYGRFDQYQDQYIKFVIYSTVSALDGGLISKLERGCVLPGLLRLLPGLS